MSNLTTENRYPDLVSMKLHSSSVSNGDILLTLPPHQSQEIELRLTIRFGMYELSDRPGQVRYGIKRGRLELKLDSGKMPLENIGLKSELEIEIEVEVQTEEGREEGLSAAISPSISTKNIAKKIFKQKQTNWQIYNLGSEENPSWHFTAQTEPPLLLGQLTKELLGIVETNGRPCSITAVFNISSQQDLHLEGSAFMTKDLVRNQRAFIEREIYLRHLYPKLKPYISKSEGNL